MPWSGSWWRNTSQHGEKGESRPVTASSARRTRAWDPRWYAPTRRTRIQGQIAGDSLPSAVADPGPATTRRRLRHINAGAWAAGSSRHGSVSWSVWAGAGIAETVGMRSRAIREAQRPTPGTMPKGMPCCCTHRRSRRHRRRDRSSARRAGHACSSRTTGSHSPGRPLRTTSRVVTEQSPEMP